MSAVFQTTQCTRLKLDAVYYLQSTRTCHGAVIIDRDALKLPVALVVVCVTGLCWVAGLQYTVFADNDVLNDVDLTTALQVHACGDTHRN